MDRVEVETARQKNRGFVYDRRWQRARLTSRVTIS